MKTIAAGLAALFVAAVAAFAKDINLPKIDLQKLCKENDAAVTAVITDVPKDAISTCVEDEQAARAQIVKEWASFPALAKSRCIQPNEFYPGYTEWPSCLQITRDAFKLRQDNGAADSFNLTDQGRAVHGSLADAVGDERINPAVAGMTDVATDQPRSAGGSLRPCRLLDLLPKGNHQRRPN